MRKLRVISLLSCVAALAACSKSQGSEARAGAAAAGSSSDAVPAPSHVLMVASVDSPQRALQGAAAYLNAVQPGAGLMLTPSLVARGLSEAVDGDGLDGLDPEKPLYVIVLVPKTHVNPVVILAGVEDAKALKRSAGSAAVRIQGKWALIGSKGAVDKVADWAFGSLAKARAPRQPTLTLHVKPLLHHYREDILDFKRHMTRMMTHQPGMSGLSALIEAEVDLFLALADQSDRVVVALEADSTTASLDVALVPREDSDFARFVKLQRPGGAQLLAKLPASPASMIMAGRFDLGPLRGPVVKLMLDLVGGALALDDAKLAEYLDVFTGEMAAVTWTSAEGHMNMNEIFIVSDAGKAMRLTREMFAPLAAKPLTIELFGVELIMSARLDEPAYDGIEVMSVTFKLDASSLDPLVADALANVYKPDGQTIMLAAWDGLFGVTFGGDARRRLEESIDASRGKRPGFKPSASAAKAFDEAAARKESVVSTMDLAGVWSSSMAMFGAPPPAPPSRSALYMGFGFADGAAHMRLALPAEHVRELQAFLKPRY